MDTLLVKLSLISYLAASAFFLLTIRSRSRVLTRSALAVSGLGAVIHITAMVWHGLKGRYLPLTNLFEGLSFVSWCVVAAFFITCRKNRNREVGGFALPLSSLILFAAFLLPEPAREPVVQWRGVWLWVHAGTALVSYGAFGMAFLAGLMYIIQERQLKRKKPGALFQWLAPLERLEAIDSRAIEIGFPLLTLAIVFGLLWAKTAPETGWAWSAKETLSFIIWLGYAGILHARRRYGLRGRKVAYMCVFGFLLVVFTFVGASVLFPGLHRFPGR